MQPRAVQRERRGRQAPPRSAPFLRQRVDTMSRREPTAPLGNAMLRRLRKLRLVRLEVHIRLPPRLGRDGATNAAFARSMSCSTSTGPSAPVLGLQRSSPSARTREIGRSTPALVGLSRPIRRRSGKLRGPR